MSYTIINEHTHCPIIEGAPISHAIATVKGLLDSLMTGQVAVLGLSKETGEVLRACRIHFGAPVWNRYRIGEWGSEASLIRIPRTTRFRSERFTGFLYDLFRQEESELYL